jgi:hypothetical protein
LAYSYSAVSSLDLDVDRHTRETFEGSRTRAFAAQSEAMELRLIMEEVLARLHALGCFGRALGIPLRRRHR